MTPAQIDLVRETLPHLMQNSSRFAPFLYERLFEIAPDVKPLFKGDLSTQHRQLTAMIEVGVKSLHDLSRLVPVLRDLGRRHSSFGVRPEHYEAFGQALLWALEESIGDLLDADQRAAWAAVYRFFARTMMLATPEGLQARRLEAQSAF